MKFNDDNLMLFDLDNYLDYGTYDTIDTGLDYSTQFVDFGCNELDQFSSLNTMKSSLIDEIDLFTDCHSTNEPDFSAAEFCEFTDSLFNSNLTNLTSSSSFNSSPSSFNNTSSNAPLNASSVSFNSCSANLTNESKSQSNLMETTSCSVVQDVKPDKRDVRKKLLDLTQRKLTNTLCYDNKLRNQVLLKSALKNVCTIDEDNLLGTKLERPDKVERSDDFKQTKACRAKYDQDDLYKNGEQGNLFAIATPRKRNFKSNSANLLNEKEILEEKNKIKKQKLCHLDDSEDYFIDGNSFNYNDELALNNLANCFIKLKTQHSHD